VASIQTPGGGGYGDPLERDPELVLQDVVNGKVSAEKARSVYGVVVDRENQDVDREATERIRRELQSEAGGEVTADGGESL
jgi:N-methylhydantoinase B